MPPKRRTSTRPATRRTTAKRPPTRRTTVKRGGGWGGPVARGIAQAEAHYGQAKIAGRQAAATGRVVGRDIAAGAQRAGGAARGAAKRSAPHISAGASRAKAFGASLFGKLRRKRAG